MRKQFVSLKAAIEHYQTQSPTRQKSQSLEPVGGCKPTYSDFDPNHPNMIWAALSLIFSDAYRELNYIECYALRYWLNFYSAEWGIKQIADYHGIDKTQLARAKIYVKEYLEDRLIDRDLMPLPDDYRPAQRNEIPVSH